jgi:hypothetical protein
MWFVNQGTPHFANAIDDIILNANTSLSVNLPEIVDDDGDSTWH